MTSPIAALLYGLTFVALSIAFDALWHERPTPRAKRKGPTRAVDSTYSPVTQVRGDTLWLPHRS